MYHSYDQNVFFVAYRSNRSWIYFRVGLSVSVSPAVDFTEELIQAIKNQNDICVILE